MIESTFDEIDTFFGQVADFEADLTQIPRCQPSDPEQLDVDNFHPVPSISAGLPTPEPSEPQTPLTFSVTQFCRLPELMHIAFDHCPLPPSPVHGSLQSGSMYVEKHEPTVQKYDIPIILVHGDYHTGQIWTSKPDGGQGWAGFFLERGFTVFVVDLPACGRSNRISPSSPEWKQLASDTHTLPPELVEAELTAVGQTIPTGTRGDGIFDNYMASTVPLFFRRHQRQSMGKEALTALLKQKGRAILIGEGSGATVCWLAADTLPNHVKAVIAVEPAGPPGGTTRRKVDNTWHYGDVVMPVPYRRPYGLTDIPLTFEPPVPEPVFSAHGVTESPLKLVPTAISTHAVFLLQRADNFLVPQATNRGVILSADADFAVPRMLVKLRQMPHLVVTAPASHHGTSDAATVAFMKQAGVDVDAIVLSDLAVYGNGHLMFLEKNSDEVAEILFSWLTARLDVNGLCFRGW